jgi:hypothetical protein
MQRPCPAIAALQAGGALLLPVRGRLLPLPPWPAVGLLAIAPVSVVTIDTIGAIARGPVRAAARRRRSLSAPSLDGTG